MEFRFLFFPSIFGFEGACFSSSSAGRLGIRVGRNINQSSSFDHVYYLRFLFFILLVITAL